MMKNLFAKFLSLSLKMKIVIVAVPSVLLVGAVATPIIITANKEVIEEPIEVADATVTSTIEENVEPVVAPTDIETIEKTEDETVVEPEEIEVTEPEVIEPETEIVEEDTEVVEEEPEVIEPEVEEPVEEVVEESTPTPDASNVNYALPYIVNGIDIRSGDVDGNGVSDNYNNTWYDGQTWTASNGIVLRIADGYKIMPGNGHYSAVFMDGTENSQPGSDFMIAFDEYCGRTTRTQISAADLPDVATPSTLQTVANKEDPSWVAYITAFDPLWQKQNNSEASKLLVVNNGNGIALTSTVGYAGYMWEMEYDSGNGCWVLEIKSNYTELIWDSIRNSIRLVCPDGEAVYNAIYEDCYNGYFAEENVYYSIGNSQVLAGYNGYIYYCIK